MSRPLRIEFPGALYHVTARGDRGEPIFESDLDRKNFLEVLRLSLERFDAACLAYCLMPNHFHLVIETRRANLSRLMRHVNGVYTQRYNRRHGKAGHLFQGRFKAILVDRDSYLLEVSRYVDLNPVRAELAEHPGDWTWSSYRAHVGLGACPPWLESDAILGCFSDDRMEARRRYAVFVSQGVGVNLWDEALNGQIYLGDEHFVSTVQSRVGPLPQSREIPRVQRRTKPLPLERYLRRPDREDGIARAYRDGYSQTEISRALGLSVSRICRIIRSQESKGKT